MGYRLILTGRRVERLEQLSESLSVPCRIIPADLSKESGCYELLEEIADEDIYVFINKDSVTVETSVTQNLKKNFQ